MSDNDEKPQLEHGLHFNPCLKAAYPAPSSLATPCSCPQISLVHAKVPKLN